MSLSRYPQCFAASISTNKDTALHIAALERHNNFANRIMPLMNDEELESQNKVGNTAFCMAAASGAIEIARLMRHRNPKLPMIRGSQQMTPLHMAVIMGRREMARYLLPLTLPDLSQEELIELLISTIHSDLYDVAMEILEEHPELAIARNVSRETPLHVLARKTKGSQFSIWKHCCNTFGRLCGHEAQQVEQLQLVERVWQEVMKQEDDVIVDLLASPWRLLFVATELGNVEFLTTLIRAYPDLVWNIDNKRRSIFHIAVEHRHEKIFRLIYETKGIKDILIGYKDDDGNTILHLAAKCPPSDRLNVDSGSALQMQHELFWFEVVKSVVQSHYVEMKNRDGKTPTVLFTEEHQELRKDGEKWMRKTAMSCMVVATLIATVAFNAIFTVPGGNNDHSGIPILQNETLFRLCAFADATSMITSTASTLMFLAILTSKYAKDDFLRSLPLKLMVGLILLFVSILSMMVAFTAALSINLKHDFASIAIAGSLLVVAILFAVQEMPLLVEVYHSTIGCCRLFRPHRRRLFRG